MPYTFPNLFAPWSLPAKRNTSSDAQEIISSSNQWISKILPQYAQPSYEAAFRKCDFGLMTLLGYYFAQGGHLRACADWVNYIFVFDDYFESMEPENMDGEMEGVMGVLKNQTQRSESESFLTILTREFWTNVVNYSHPSQSSTERFCSEYKEYLKAVIQEVRDRKDGRIRTLEEHIILRRGTAGGGPVFVFTYLPDDIPDEIIDHPSVKELTLIGLDLFGLANDIQSFNREQSIGQTHNAVISALHDRKSGIQDAIDHVYGVYKELVSRFLVKKATLPSFPDPYNELLASYLERVQYMIIGYNEWSVSTGRYFGDAEREVGQPIVAEVSAVEPVSFEEWFQSG